MQRTSRMQGSNFLAGADDGLAIAFVMVHTASGIEEETLKNVLGVKQVREAHTIYGVFDILVKVEGRSLQDVNRAIMEIRNVRNVRGTMSLLVAET
ncbi:MAG: Lrp/AsnC ligand binding domain-containing protein [Nitrososphaerales archaeon]